MSDLIIASVEHAELLSDLMKQTFTESWTEPGIETDLHSYMDEHFNLKTVREELLNPAMIYLLVIKNECPVAYVKLERNACPLVICFIIPWHYNEFM